MKFFIRLLLCGLMPAIVYSCHGVRTEEVPSSYEHSHTFSKTDMPFENDEDTSVLIDFFEWEHLESSEAVKRKISENVSYFLYGHAAYKDAFSLHVDCKAIWNSSQNDKPSHIKICEIDTNLFYVTINPGLGSEIQMDWHSDKPLLRIIKSILDTATYTLHVNEELAYESYLGYYWGDSIVTAIDIKI